MGPACMQAKASRQIVVPSQIAPIAGFQKKRGCIPFSWESRDTCRRLQAPVSVGWSQWLGPLRMNGLAGVARLLHGRLGGNIITACSSCAAYGAVYSDATWRLILNSRKRQSIRDVDCNSVVIVVLRSNMCSQVVCAFQYYPVKIVLLTVYKERANNCSAFLQEGYIG